MKASRVTESGAKAGALSAQIYFAEMPAPGSGSIRLHRYWSHLVRCCPSAAPRGFAADLAGGFMLRTTSATVRPPAKPTTLPGRIHSETTGPAKNPSVRRTWTSQRWAVRGLPLRDARGSGIQALPPTRGHAPRKDRRKSARCPSLERVPACARSGSVRGRQCRRWRFDPAHRCSTGARPGSVRSRARVRRPPAVRCLRPLRAAQPAATNSRRPPASHAYALRRLEGEEAKCLPCRLEAYHLLTEWGLARPAIEQHVWLVRRHVLHSDRLEARSVGRSLTTQACSVMPASVSAAAISGVR